MKIKDKPEYKNKLKPITFSPRAKIQEALDVMCAKNIGSIAVVNKDQTIAGIVTERDLMIKVLGKKLDPTKATLSKIMTKNVWAANEDDDVVDWMQTMSRERFRHLPIVDEDGKLVSMMSQGDFVAFTWPELYEKVKQDIKGRVARSFQFLLIGFAALTLGLIVLGL